MRIKERSCGVSIKPSDAVPDTLFIRGVDAALNRVSDVIFAPGGVNIIGTSSDESRQTSNPTTLLPAVIPTTTQDEDEAEAEGAYESAYQAAQLSPKMRRLTDLAIVTELVTGSPVEVIAKNYRVDVLYVSRIRGEWLKACRLQEATVGYRGELKVLALEAIRDGLKAKQDPYKRSAQGIRVMQGINEFKQDAVNVAVLSVANIPAELRSRFITSSATDEQKAIEAEIVKG